MKTRTEIINILFKQYNFQSYLEIGVRVPAENFDKINAKIKESVDPNPMGVCTYITTSDDFFENYASDKMYDVIFVDGMHTAEQSYKDVKNAINHLNDGGFIVMHDCNPPTEYHIRSYEEYLKTGGQWNGTVFRGFIQLKNELSNWSCFVIDEDWGCAILTKRKIFENKHSNYNSNNISWNEFDVNRKEILQLITFNKYCNIIGNKITALIINYNRLILPMNMADYLFDCGITPVIIDNHSVYQPLLEYYKTCKYEVIKLNQNYGHTVVWDTNILNRLNIDGEYIITDPDLDISNIPKDFLNVLREGLNKYPKYDKCGFSLRLTDLPNNHFTHFIYKTEINYWRKPLDNIYFDAAIDTTFALYRTGVKIKTFNSIRTNEPYSAKHVPWYYTKMNELSEDEKYYFKTIQTSTYYSHNLK